MDTAGTDTDSQGTVEEEAAGGDSGVGGANTSSEEDPGGEGGGGLSAPVSEEREAPHMVQSGCRTLFTYFPVESARAAAYLPEGFEPVQEDAAGATVRATLKAWRCTNTTVEDASVGEVASLVLYFPVDPPARYERSDIDCDYVLAHTFVDSAPVADLYETWNFGTVHRTEVLVAAVAGGAQGAQRANTAADGIEVDLLAGMGWSTTNSAYTCRYFGVEGGNATNGVNIPVAESTRRTGSGALAFAGLEPFGMPGVPSTVYRQDWSDDTVAYTWTNRTLD